MIGMVARDGDLRTNRLIRQERSRLIDRVGGAVIGRIVWLIDLEDGREVTALRVTLARPSRTDPEATVGDGVMTHARRDRPRAGDRTDRVGILRLDPVDGISAEANSAVGSDGRRYPFYLTVGAVGGATVQRVLRRSGAFGMRTRWG